VTRATVVIPTHDHGPTLVHSVGSVLAQTVDDFELLVIGDGVPDAARAICLELERSDERVTFFDLPKGPRHGELHRDRVLAGARGRIVCYLSDDDLWLPGHLAEMDRLLADADFAHTLPVSVDPEGRIDVFRMEVSSPWFRPQAFDDRGIRGAYVPLSFGGHTLAAYRALPEGWSTTPRPLSTDRYMWHKFLRRDEVRAVTGNRPTGVHFPSTERRGWSEQDRLAELERWDERLAGPDAELRFALDVLDAVARDRALADARVGRRLGEAVMRPVRTSPRWRAFRDRR
jgi:GalNAc5-diNAcBac-PP-undecaprenol beta-1,3-glucosyltransferase